MSSLFTATNHIQVEGTLKIDLGKALNMQGLYTLVQDAYPNDPTLTVTGISIPLFNIGCKELGVIDPITDIKEAISRLYDQLMKSYLEPIFIVLKKLFDALKHFGLADLDLTIPILNLHISDLFSKDLYDKLKARLLDLYNNAKDQLLELLKLLEIPYPFFTDFSIPELEIDEIVKRVKASLWTFFYKIISKIVELIELGLKAYDLATTKKLVWSELWKELKQAILGKILDLLLRMPTFQEIEDAIKAYAKLIYGKAEATYEELMAIIKNFKLPIFGNPFDWIFPIDFTVNRPNIDFAKIVSDIKIWLNNFVGQIIAEFVKAIDKILKLFGLSFVIPVIEIPVILCAVKNPS